MPAPRRKMFEKENGRTDAGRHYAQRQDRFYSRIVFTSPMVSVGIALAGNRRRWAPESSWFRVASSNTRRFSNLRSGKAETMPRVNHPPISCAVNQRKPE